MDLFANIAGALGKNFGDTVKIIVRRAMTPEPGKGQLPFADLLFFSGFIGLFEITLYQIPKG